MRSEIRGVAVTIAGLAGTSTRVKARAFGAVVRGLQKARNASLKEITAGDHSLAVLAAMGHPYATRHPDPPHADPIIHQQTGAYVRAMRVTPPVGTPGEIIEGRIDMNGDPAMKQLDRWLQEGTMKMIARPWMKDVVEKVGPEIRAAIVREIRAAIAEERPR